MKKTRYISVFHALGVATVLSSHTPALAQGQDPLVCEFVRIVPEGADFFTGSFRPYPVVGSKFVVNFGHQQIRSITFTDGTVFFHDGEATLNRLTRGAGFGGVRQGMQGFYIGQLTGPQVIDGREGVFSSRFAITNAWRDESFHLVTHETHYGDLECKVQGLAN